MPRMDIFVSYSRRNQAVVKALVGGWTSRLRDYHESAGGRP
jgi:hypothetical protein